MGSEVIPNINTLILYAKVKYPELEHINHDECAVTQNCWVNVNLMILNNITSNVH